MKRDPDLIRAILLLVEESPPDEHIADFSSLALDQALIVEHIKLLQDAHLVDARVQEYMVGASAIILRMTSAGHDFLDRIRDPEIWRKTKEGAQKAGGFSLELLGALAKGLVKKKIEQHTGVDLDLD